MCVGGEKKPVKPSSFEYLIADTLLAYVDSKCITPQEAEEKLQQWGARAVRVSICFERMKMFTIFGVSIVLCLKYALGCFLLRRNKNQTTKVVPF